MRGYSLLCEIKARGERALTAVSALIVLDASFFSASLIDAAPPMRVLPPELKRPAVIS